MCQASAASATSALEIDVVRDAVPDYPRFTDLQVSLPRVESLTLHDVPGEQHQTEVVIHHEFGATVSIRLISDRRIRLTDLRGR